MAVSKKIILPIEGMTCASCVERNERILRETGGVLAADVNFATEKASVEYDPDQVSVWSGRRDRRHRLQGHNREAGAGGAGNELRLVRGACTKSAHGCRRRGLRRGQPGDRAGDGGIPGAATTWSARWSRRATRYWLPTKARKRPRTPKRACGGSSSGSCRPRCWSAPRSRYRFLSAA